ncbi:hypothetical protein COLO4_33662 [Corchorus olitorius]|uniref:Uncharacterized protein n=1 Tax=Corchorus olitorius TaxID=93759 RepID=A0A1R3GS48_9ROSI|nr:hypothetical protein COLO4_33662 [Corchorus olitorius]
MGAKFGIAFLVLLLAVSKQQQVNGYGLQQEDSEVEEDEVCARINENSCDPFQGDWVFDDSYPPFNTSVCQFLSLDQHYDCQYSGRPDGDYLKYRWQPTDCDLPRIDTEDFLSRLRGKKLLFVGEHFGFNQYQSLTCTLVASSKRSLLYNAFTSEDNSTFRFPEYDDARVYYTPKPFLVDLISDPAKGRVLKIDSIGGGSGKTAWKDMDVLIFNSWYSWTDNGITLKKAK